VTFRRQILSPSYYVSTKLEAYVAFLLQENWRHWMDRHPDRWCGTVNVAHNKPELNEFCRVTWHCCYVLL